GGTFTRPDGLAMARDGAQLYVAHAFGMAEIDIPTSSMRRVRPARGSTLGGIGGLHVLDDGLVAIQVGAGHPRVVRFRFGPTRDVLREEVLESLNPLFAAPAGGALHDQALYYLANSHSEPTDGEGRYPPP